ncbi:acetoin reductase family protein [Desarmillaria tabescens]|uniref:3-oxoacyl-[acyl-carrier-protein] reductase n=1 Tax=Armillaria tabescens TaxID=1929756 RepID=A0AA39JVP2_ARMTA|nr:acetoin reductase family protein [Desarmillaria tabescens]KAK0449669.1 acetoin reductase family protein [Desarmillaria tabescens]
MAVALVTCSTQGVGRAIALRLADDGFDVAVNDLTSRATVLEALVCEITLKGRRSCAVLGDASSEADVQKMISSTVEELGSLDVMVANAGVCVTKSILSTSSEEWNRIAAINSHDTFLCHKYAAKQMQDQGRGLRIIGASSIAGKRGPPISAACRSSKLSAHDIGGRDARLTCALSSSQAPKFSRYGVTINAYAPAPTDTEMRKKVVGIGKTLTGDWKRAHEKDRSGAPADIASMVSYLASKEAHFAVTGHLNVMYHCYETIVFLSFQMSVNGRSWCK